MILSPYLLSLLFNNMCCIKSFSSLEEIRRQFLLTNAVTLFVITSNDVSNPHQNDGD